MRRVDARLVAYRPNPDKPSRVFFQGLPVADRPPLEVRGRHQGGRSNFLARDSGQRSARNLPKEKRLADCGFVKGVSSSTARMLSSSI